MNFFQLVFVLSISTLVLVAGDCPSSNAHILANNEEQREKKKKRKSKKFTESLGDYYTPCFE